MLNRCMCAAETLPMIVESLRARGNGTFPSIFALLARCCEPTVRLQREIRWVLRGKNNAVRRAGCVKLANRRAGYLSSLPLIRAGGAQREILLCEAAGCRRLKDESLTVLAAKLPCAGHDTSPFQAAGLGVINSRGDA